MVPYECTQCGRERPAYIYDPTCPNGGYCTWVPHIRPAGPSETKPRMTTPAKKLHYAGALRYTTTAGMSVNICLSFMRRGGIETA